MKRFDYVIAGSGAAGLTLAFLLMRSENTKKSTLIIDRSAKNSNDRTWCFWEKGPNLLENLVFKNWSAGCLYHPSFEKCYSLTPYQYKMIRGIDFYEYMQSHLDQFPQIERIQADVQEITSEGEVITDRGSFKGGLVFDSTKGPQDFEGIDDSNYLLQHFKGYFLKTEQPKFNPDQFTYMDFRLPQEGDFRFGYVLPFSKTEALVEYTLFNKELLSDEDYNKGLHHYIDEVLQLGSYQINEVEQGVIPMTDYAFPLKISDRVYRIGISGGFAKPSTGYTFLRGQHILKKLVSNLNEGLQPDHMLPYQSVKYKKYDSTLLRVLSSKDNHGDQVFADMFRKNGMLTMFRFLDEETSLREELGVMSSTPIFKFGKAFLKSL